MPRTLKHYAVEALVYTAPRAVNLVVQSGDSKSVMTKLQRHFSKQGAVDIQVKSINPLEYLSDKETDPAEAEPAEAIA